jgi:hypothetical protein
MPAAAHCRYLAGSSLENDHDGNFFSFWQMLNSVDDEKTILQRSSDIHRVHAIARTLFIAQNKLNLRLK